MGVNARPSQPRRPIAGVPRAAAPRSAGGGTVPRSPAARTVIRVRVGRLVLDGLARADHGRVAAALAARLAELVDQAPDLDWTVVSRAPRIDGGAVRAGTAPAELGRHLAAQIVRGLTR